jgi:hypothetical protein
MHAQKPDERPDYVDPDFVQRTLQQLLEQISKRDQKISWITAEKMAAERSFLEKEQTLLNKISERDVLLHYTRTQLTDREAQLNEILNSRTWKFALLLQRIRVFLIPRKKRGAQE